MREKRKAFPACLSRHTFWCSFLILTVLAVFQVQPVVLLLVFSGRTFNCLFGTLEVLFQMPKKNFSEELQSAFIQAWYDILLSRQGSMTTPSREVAVLPGSCQPTRSWHRRAKSHRRAAEEQATHAENEGQENSWGGSSLDSYRRLGGKWLWPWGRSQKCAKNVSGSKKNEFEVNHRDCDCASINVLWWRNQCAEYMSKAGAFDFVCVQCYNHVHGVTIFWQAFEFIWVLDPHDSLPLNFLDFLLPWLLQAAKAKWKNFHLWHKCFFRSPSLGSGGTSVSSV